jgi:mono/diheme cytochrome c family protein
MKPDRQRQILLCLVTWVAVAVVAACLPLRSALAGEDAAAHRLPYSPAQAAQQGGDGVFHASGCVQCRSIDGMGGDKGPDLSGVGRRLKKNGLRRQILNGRGAMPAFAAALTVEGVDAPVHYLQRRWAKNAPRDGPDAASPQAPTSAKELW